MYCIRCGVKLADAEEKCPLCNTVVYHPDFAPSDAEPLYPRGKYPKPQVNSRVWNGILIFLFLIPMIVCTLADYHANGSYDWFDYVIGGLLVGYIALALPLWFKKPNPVIFVPCNFATVTLYLLYICLKTGGNWFLSFAFPVAGALCLITSALTSLIHYVRGGRFYIWGGACIAYGLVAALIEFLVQVTFGIPFMGWSIYPLGVFVLVGLGLIYLGIDKSAREALARKLFI